MDIDLPGARLITPWRAQGDKVVLSVKLTPNGGSDSIDGVEVGPEEKAYLKIRVCPVPQKGKANKALIALLAKKLRIAKSSLTLISGETSRQKILRIDGEPEDLIVKLTELVKLT